MCREGRGRPDAAKLSPEDHQPQATTLLQGCDATAGDGRAELGRDATIAHRCLTGLCLSAQALVVEQALLFEISRVLRLALGWLGQGPSKCGWHTALPKVRTT
jgi:hypothetical protein